MKIKGLQKKEAYLKAICSRIGPIFEQAQLSSTNHAKNWAALYKLHLEASRITVDREAKDLERAKKRQIKYDLPETTVDDAEEGKQKETVPLGEYRFRDAFFDMVLRCLGMDKVNLSTTQDPTPLIQNLSAFVAGYISHVSRKGKWVLENASLEVRANPGWFLAAEAAEETVEDPTEEDTMEERFVQTTVKLLLRGFDAYNRNVRYRSVDVVFRTVKELGAQRYISTST
jgi:condensin complex subunit 3